MSQDTFSEIARELVNNCCHKVDNPVKRSIPFMHDDFDELVSYIASAISTAIQEERKAIATQVEYTMWPLGDDLIGKIAQSIRQRSKEK